MIFIDYPDVRDALAIVVCFGAASATRRSSHLGTHDVASEARDWCVTSGTVCLTFRR